MQGWAKGLKDRVERTATQLSTQASTAFTPSDDEEQANGAPQPLAIASSTSVPGNNTAQAGEGDAKPSAEGALSLPVVCASGSVSGVRAAWWVMAWQVKSLQKIAHFESFSIGIAAQRVSYNAVVARPHSDSTAIMLVECGVGFVFILAFSQLTLINRDNAGRPQLFQPPNHHLTVHPPPRNP